MAMHDENYTDYSCSTSIERLARDVETALRSWHVADGSDRHASMSTATAAAGSSRGSGGGGVLVAPVHSRSVISRQIRSQRISWQLSFFLQSGVRISCSLQLELCLWDGPTLVSQRSVNEDKGTATNDGGGSTTSLPFSLRRSSSMSPASLFSVSTDSRSKDVFENFSTLFGIGQHISLTPTQSELNSFNQQTTQQRQGSKEKQQLQQHSQTTDSSKQPPLWKRQRHPQHPQLQPQ